MKKEWLLVYVYKNTFKIKDKTRLENVISKKQW